MAKQVVKLGLEFDTKAAIASYRDLVSEMSKGGADPKAIKQFTAAIEKAETELAQLAAEGSTGFTDSKGIEQYQKKVLKVTTSMQQLALRMQDFSREGKNFPLSEAGQLEKKIKDLKKAVTDLAEEAKKNLQSSLKNMGFSKTQAAEIANAVKNEEELRQRLEQERQLRQKNLDLAKEQAQASVDAARGTKASSVESNSTRVKALTPGVDKISGIKPEVIKETVAEAFRSGIRKGVNNASDIVTDLKKTFAQKFGEGTEITNALSQMLDKGLEASGDNISGWLNSIALKTGDALNPEKFKDLVAALKQVSVAQTHIVAGQFGAKMEESAQAAKDAATAEGQLGTATTNTNKVLQQSEQTANGIAGSMERAAEGFIKTSNAEKESLKSTEALEGGFNKLADRLKYMFGFTAMFNRLRQIIRSTFNDIQELDKAYASIAYVTNETVGSLWQTYGDYASMAEKLGQSTADIIKASAIYRQQGLDTAEAIELTTDTMKLATIAGNDYSTATQEMTAALRGFKMEMDEGSHVSDVYSELAAHAAASVDDIAQAMSRTASIANSAGMSFENTSAFLTQMIETTQESAENIGTSMKTIIARFTELKNNVAGTADSEFEDLDFNKVDIALKSVGVSLKDTTGQFRNLDDVFLELSEKWSTLDRNTQRYIATVAAGSRQQSRFIAMMDNYERTIELIDTVADSEGKADEQFAKAADTVAFKLNAIKTQWEEFKLGLMDSSFMKGILDTVNNILSGLKNMKMPAIALGSAIAIPAAKSFIMMFIQNAKKAATSLQTLGKFIASKIPKINFQANADDINKKINEIKEKIQRVNASRESKIELKIAREEELRKTNQDIEILTEKLKALQSSSDSSESEINQVSAELETLKNQANATSNEIADLNSQVNNQKNVLDQADKELKKYEIDMEGAQAKSQGMSQAFSFVGQSLSIMIGMLVSGAKASDVFNTMLVSMATQAIPMLINTFSSFISMRMANVAAAKIDEATTIKAEAAKRAAYLKTAAVQKVAMMTNVYMLAIAGTIALIAALGKLIAKNKEKQKQMQTEYKLQSEINRIQNLKSATSSAKNELQTAKDELKTTEEKIDRFNELSEMQIRTTEEQKEYNDLVAEIRSEYPSIVESYNNITGQLIIQEDKTKNILDMQRQLVVEQQKSYALAQNNLYDAQIRKASLETAQNLEKYGDITSLNSKKSDKYASYSGDTSDARNRSWNWNKSSTFSQGIVNARNNGLNSEQAIEYNLKRYGIDKDTFLKQAGQNKILTEEQWNELADRLANNSDDIYKVIEESVEKSTKAIQDERDKVTQYYKDMKATSIKQTLLTEFENLGEASAEAISKGATENGASYFAQTAASNQANYMATAWNPKNASTVDTLNTLSIVTLGITGFVGAAISNNLDAWEKLDEDTRNIWKEVGKQHGHENAAAWYEEIRYDDEDYQPYLEDFASVAETYFSQKIAEDIALALENNPKLAQTFEDFSAKLVNGELNEEQRHEQFMTVQKVIQDSNLDDETKQRLLQSLYSANNQYKQNLSTNKAQASKLINNEDYLNNLNLKQLGEISGAVDKIINSVGEDKGQEYLDKLSEMMEQYGPEMTASLATAIDFSEANDYNWEDFKEKGIQKIMEMAHVNEDTAKTMFNNLADAAKDSGILNKLMTGADVNSLQEQIAGREEALLKHKDIVDKIMGTNKPLKLTQQEIKNLQKTVSDLAAQGVKLDLTKYLKGDTLDARAFNETLTNELLYSIENIDEAINNLKKAGGKENLAVAEQLENVKIAAQSFNIGAKETFENWEELDRIINDTARDLESVDKIMNQFINDGYVNAESLELINSLLKDENDLYKYVDSNLALNVEGLKELIHTELEDIKVKYAHGEATAYQVLKLAALEKQISNTEKEWNEQSKNLEDKHKKAMEDYAKAQEDVIEKQKALNEAIEEYNRLLYGSDNRNSGLDLLYNYKEAISAFSDEMSRAQDILEDSSSVNDAINALQKYTSAAHSRLAWLGAQSNVYDQGLNERRNNLLNNSTSYDDERTGKRTTIKFSDYVKYNANTGLMSINQSLIQNAKIADHWKDYIEKQVDDYNKLYQENLKNQDEIRKLEKEIQKRREDAIKKYADFEKDIAETLKSVYQEQVDNLKEKYDSMKEADDDYVNALQEAIEKQRKLRDRENKWEELAQKEKKLSLMSRDTSGANALETQKLEKEVQKDREQLLDESIDSVIENMQKLAEKQDELRQVEIELKEALLDNTAYWNQQAEQVASGFQTAEDYVEWFKNTAAGLNEQTATQFEVTMNEAREKFNNASEAIAWNIMDDMELTGDSVEQTINVTAQEIKDIVNSTSTDFITAVKNTFETTKTEFDKNMDSAIEKVNSATKAYNEACEKAKELADEINKQLGNGGYSGNNKEEDLGYRPSTIHSAEEAYHQYTETRDTGNAWWASKTPEEKAYYQYAATHDTGQTPAELQQAAYSQYMSNSVKDQANKKKIMEQELNNNLQSLLDKYSDYNIVDFTEKENIDPVLQDILATWLKKNYPGQAYKDLNGHLIFWRTQIPKGIAYKERYETGGLVNYTGPAWVDGSPQRPEAFLSAEDTERIGNAAKLLTDIPSLNQSNISTTNASYGDTNVEINLNIDHISSDVDIDAMLERVKTEIVDIARPIGTNVILHQQV